MQPTSSSSWCVSYVLEAVHHWIIMYQNLCKKGGVHILKSSEVLKQQKVFAESRDKSFVESRDKSSSTEIVESRDKSFVLDLKLLFTIVNCFSGMFPSRFFTMKLVCFIGFPKSLYLVLFNFSLCMILIFVYFKKVSQ